MRRQNWKSGENDAQKIGAEVTPDARLSSIFEHLRAAPFCFSCKMLHYSPGSCISGQAQRSKRPQGARA